MKKGLNHREAFFAANGFGPYACFHCGEPIDKYHGAAARALIVHHLDEDHSNNEPTNLAPVHRTCHGKVHERWNKGVKMSPEWCEENRLRNLGRKRSPETRARISAARKQFYAESKRLGIDVLPQRDGTSGRFVKS